MKKFFKKEKLNKLIELARTKKYSAPKLAKKFRCDRKTIFRILKDKEIMLPNLGRFKKRIYCNEKFFKKLNKISAYWLGFIAADGVLSLRDKSVLICLSEKDKKHLYKFKKAIKTNAKIGLIKSNRSAHIGICDKDLFESLVERGVTPNKSLSIKKVKFPQRLSSHFIRGVFDGDGSISGSDISHIQLMIAGNKEFLEQLQDILIKNCKLNRVKLYRLTKGNAYKLQYTGPQIFKILKFLYRNSNKNMRLDRKYTKYLIFKRKFKADALHAAILDYENKKRKNI
ncbi:hypothetical protein HZA33_00130 [Candidatus Pacearchaeota archaeon]|nr:hypothetical protein [Candidatus Pacearchaeota archaeon]